jgi:hypothetical protein
MEDERIPVEQVLVGMGLHPLPPEWTPVEALVLIKSLDQDGDPRWSFRTTARPNKEELLGALIVHTDLLRKELVSGWEEEDDD